MHGRPRDYKHKLKDPRAQEANAKKVHVIRSGTDLVLACHAAKRYDAAALDASAKLLKVVPEIYTLWNFRREALTPVFAAGGPAAQAASAGELALTYACITENPKSYSTWHHRKWVVLKGLCSLNSELDIISGALDQDVRNFHAWHYRRFIVGLMGRPASKELAYTEDKIAQNFSNYSAWHYRTVLLPRVHCGAGGEGSGGGMSVEHQLQQKAVLSEPADAFSRQSCSSSHPPAAASAAAAQESPPAAAEGRTATSIDASAHPEDVETDAAQREGQSTSATDRQAGASGTSGGGQPSAQPLQQQQQQQQQQTPPIPVEVLDEEYDLVQQAFATDSEDQAPWMYYQWLMVNSVAHLDLARGTAGEEAARAQLKAVLQREIARFEEDHIAAAPNARWPLVTVARLKQTQARLNLCDGPVEQALVQVRAAFDHLISLDPMRRGYYQDERDKLASYGQFTTLQACA